MTMNTVDSSLRKWIIGVAGIVVVGLVTIWFFRPHGSGPIPTSTQPLSPPPVESGRIQQTYQEGATYRMESKYTLAGQGRHKDFGLDKSYSYAIAGVLSYDSHFEKNDGKDLVVVVTVNTSRFLEVRSQVDSVKVDLGRRAHGLLEAAGTFARSQGYLIPPGISRIAENAINEFLQTSVGRELSQQLALSPFNVDSIEGAKVRIAYQNGEGVQNIELLDFSPQRDFGGVAPVLDETAKRYFKDFNPIPDAYIFPKEDVAVGATWPVKGSALPIYFPVEWNARIAGEVTMQLAEDSAGIANIQIAEGALLISATPSGRSAQGRLVPKGSLAYSRTDRIVTQIEMTGDMQFTQGSTGHWLFEMKQEEKPRMTIEYSCKKLP